MDLIVPRRPVNAGGGGVGALYGGGGPFSSCEKWTICSNEGGVSCGMRRLGERGKRAVQFAIKRTNVVFGRITAGGGGREEYSKQGKRGKVFWCVITLSRGMRDAQIRSSMLLGAAMRSYLVAMSRP
jgi:hypothetical protein